MLKYRSQSYPIVDMVDTFKLENRIFPTIDVSDGTVGMVSQTEQKLLSTSRSKRVPVYVP